MVRSSLAAVLCTATLSAAQWNWGRGNGGHHHWWGNHGTPASMGGIQNSTFQQVLDHSDPSKGTFSQLFYYDTTYWKGPGSPVVMFAPQEVAASEYTALITNVSVAGILAQELGAATVLMEHRYWGDSSPYAELTTENMQYQTLDNAIADCTNFARNVRLPFAEFGSNANEVPWVLIGGSYSGALTAWVEAKAPGTFWASLASSGVVEAISDFWGYFAQVQAGMPTNCSKDVSLVVDHMDSVLMTGTAQEIFELKSMFGLETVEHNDDFMEALANGPYLWQANDFVSNGGFFEWCDFIEDSVNQTDKALLPGAEGVGLTKALNGYATWMKNLFLPGYCEGTYGYFKGENNTECFDSYNASNPIYADMTVANTGDRQWEWFLCNQPFGWWQDGAPAGTPTIVSRLVNAEYFIRQCGLYFPTGPQGQTYGIAKGASEAEVNSFTGGWFIDNTTRLVYTNGQFDPWRDATVSSFLRPGGPLASTAQVPVNIVPSGYHCTDLLTANAEVNAGCRAVFDSEKAQLAQWVSEFPRQHQWRA